LRTVSLCNRTNTLDGLSTHLSNPPRQRPQWQPPIGPPPAPMPPRKRRYTTLIVVLVIVALVCCGVPGSLGGWYVLRENGPYNRIDTVCGLLKSETSKRYTGGVPGRVARSSSTDGCQWDKGGDFLLVVPVDLEHKRGFNSNRAFRDPGLAMYQELEAGLHS
jgi:hypothetical protein